MIAALFIEDDSVYLQLTDIDPWPRGRDARLYQGPHPVVAHPPCERWGRYWSGGPSTKVRHRLGDDGGCFAAALAAVRRWSGVLEHPQASHAWAAHGLNAPPPDGGWIPADFEGGATCCVEQGHYGHMARKATWLYAHGVPLPQLQWGPAPPGRCLKQRPYALRSSACERLSRRQRAATPLPFRDLLVSIARGACYQDG